MEKSGRSAPSSQQQPAEQSPLPLQNAPAPYSPAPAPVSSLSRNQPSPPPGMRLGAEYVSALNEPCYELYPQDGTLSQPLAMCMRQGGWTLVPGIFMSVPPGGVAPYAAPSTEAAPLFMDGRQSQSASPPRTDGLLAMHAKAQTGAVSGSAGLYR